MAGSGRFDESNDPVFQPVKVSCNEHPFAYVEGCAVCTAEAKWRNEKSLANRLEAE